MLQTYAYTTPIASVGNTYAAAKAAPLVLPGPTLAAGGRAIKPGRLVSLRLDLSSISGAASLTVRLCADAACDVPITPDADATIAVGVTTATAGTAVVLCQDLGPIYCSTAGTVYVLARTNAGTVTVDRVLLTLEPAAGAPA